MECKSAAISELVISALIGALVISALIGALVISALIGALVISALIGALVISALIGTLVISALIGALVISALIGALVISALIGALVISALIGALVISALIGALVISALIGALVISACIHVYLKCRDLEERHKAELQEVITQNSALVEGLEKELVEARAQISALQTVVVPLAEGHTVECSFQGDNGGPAILEVDTCDDPSGESEQVRDLVGL